MLLFELAEVTTAFTHNFFGIKTATLNGASYLSALIGALYAAAGASVGWAKAQRAVPTCRLNVTLGAPGGHRQSADAHPTNFHHTFRARQ